MRFSLVPQELALSLMLKVRARLSPHGRGCAKPCSARWPIVRKAPEPAASLNWYRANLAPRMPGSPPELPPVEAPTLGIWSTNDHYLDGERMKMSGRFVRGPWRYEQIDGTSHWIPLDASDRLNELLIEWLR